MKKLFLDIETTPHVAYVWRLYDENVGPSQLIEPTRMLCLSWTADDEEPRFAAEWHRGGRRRMVRQVWQALNDCDALIHYNGRSFDEKHLNREFLQAGLTPPSAFKTIDLYRVVKQRFKFASSKLVQVARELEVREGKLTTNFDLWRRAMAGDPDARAEMEAYNREDVALLVDLYDELLPWIGQHPNVALYEDGEAIRCTRCGSESLVRDGLYRTGAGVFQKYRCKDCGGQSRGAKRLGTTPLREVP